MQGSIRKKTKLLIKNIRKYKCTVEEKILLKGEIISLLFLL